MTDGIKLFEDEEDYPFEYLCPEDDNLFIRTNEITINNDLLNLIHDLKYSTSSENVVN